MPGVYKLGFFRKLLIGLGKRIYYRKTEKVNVLGVSLMIRAVLRQYQEVLGSLDKAMKIFQSQVAITADEVITNLIYEPLMLGVSMSFALSRAIQDGPFTIHALIWGMIGKAYNKTFEYPLLELNEDGTGKFIIRTKGKSCILCSGVHDVTIEDLGDNDYGDILATLFGTIIREAWKYLESPYELLESKETKCILRGDPCCEITISFKSKY
ncbi:MAG: hypothetical protein ACTSYB_06310 [Candidatus Helarchaeota archaeon]